MVKWFSDRNCEGIRRARQLGLLLTRHQRVAFRYLEMEGQRFCVEFGTANAIDKMRDHLAALSSKQRIH